MTEDLPLTVGRLTITLHGDDDARPQPYRATDAGKLVVERGPGAAPAPKRRAPVVLVIALINLALLGFATYVRSWPAITAVSAAMTALGWLVFFLGRSASGTLARVELGERLRAGALDLPLAAVDGVGVGVGDAWSRTVWVRTAGERTPVLEALTAEEASAAAEALRDALDRRRTRAPESEPSVPPTDGALAPHSG